MSVRVSYRYVRPLSVLYARAMGPYETSTQEAWDRMESWLGQHNARRLIKRGYGFIRDNPKTTPAEVLRYDACIGLVGDLDADPSAGIGRQILPGGAYAVHTHVGPYSQMGEILSALQGPLVQKRGLTLDHDRPFLTIYLNDPAVTREVHRRTELCVPVLPICVPAFNNDASEQNGVAGIVDPVALRA